MISKSRPNRPGSPKSKRESKIKFTVSRSYLECFLPKSIGAKSVSKKVGKSNTNRTPYH
jgi:hypothetical protein